MKKTNDASYYRHEINNALIALEILAQELKSDTLEEGERKERLLELEEFVKKMSENWEEFKKIKS